MENKVIANLTDSAIMFYYLDKQVSFTYSEKFFEASGRLAFLADG